MAIWLVRAGSNGEYESKFLNDNRIYLTWERSNHDLALANSKLEMYNKLMEDYPEQKKATLRNWTGQVYSFVKEMKPGDWVVLPSKLKAAIHFGEITGAYGYDSRAEHPFFHSRKTDWFARDIPRSNFDQDILYSFGAFLTICRIRRNNAEERIKAMFKNNWQPVKLSTKSEDLETEVEGHGLIDLEEYSRDQIA